MLLILAMAGGDGLAIAKDVYRGAFGRFGSYRPLTAAYSSRRDSTSSNRAVTCSSLTCWSMLMQHTPVSQGFSD